MTNMTRSLLLLSAFALVPAAGAFAQTSTPNNTRGSGGLIAHETYPQGSAAAHDPALEGRTHSTMSVPSAENPKVPGATGTTIVKGDHSTIASDRNGSIDQKTGQVQSIGGSSAQ